MRDLHDFVSRFSVRENPLKAERRTELVAIVLFFLLCLQIVLGLLSIVMDREVDSIAPSSDVLTAVRLSQVDQVEADSRNEIVSRPVFWEGRLQLEAEDVVVVEVDAKKTANEKLKGAKLVGTYGDGASGGVILREKDSKRRLGIGGDFKGWKLDAVGPNSARFVKGASVDELILQRVDASTLVKVVPSASKQESKGVQDRAPAKTSLGLGGIDRG